MTVQVKMKIQDGKISKIEKSTGWNKAVQARLLGILLLWIIAFVYKSQHLIKVQVGKFLKFIKVCCTIIRKTYLSKCYTIFGKFNMYKSSWKFCVCLSIQRTVGFKLNKLMLNTTQKLLSQLQWVGDQILLTIINYLKYWAHPWL